MPKATATQAELPTELHAPVESVLMDGFWIDPETGEVIGEETPIEEAELSEDQAESVLARMRRYAARQASARNRFEWAHEMMTLKEAEAIKLLEQDPEYLDFRAAAEQAVAIEARAAKVSDYLVKRYLEPLGDLARRLMQGKRDRTYKFFGGDVSLKKVPGNIEVTDEEAAIQSLRGIGATECIKESVSKSNLNKRKDVILELELAGFREVPEGEKVTVNLKVEPK